MKLGKLDICSRVLEPESGLIFLVAAQNHPGYGGTTLFAEKIIELGCMDAAEPARSARLVFEHAHLYGWNDYGTSNLHQWLNSADENWYKSQTPSDQPPEGENLRYQEVPYTQRPGFLRQFGQNFRDALLEVDIPYLQRSSLDHGSLTSVRGRVFLPSRTEMGKGDECGCAEGAMMPLFYDPSVYRTTMTDALLKKYGREINPERPTAHYDAPQIYDPKYGWWYWLRTANMGYAYLNRVASPYGALSYTYSNNDSVGIRPMVNLDPELEVSSNMKYRELFTIEN